MALAIPLAMGLLAATVDPGMALIDADAEAGLLSEDDAAVQRFYRLFDEADGDPRYNAAPWTGDPTCGTPVLMDVQSRWDRLSGETTATRAMVTGTTWSGHGMEELLRDRCSAGHLDGRAHAPQIDE